MAVISLSINTRAVDLDIDPDTPLLWAVRDHLNLVGTKFGCGGGFCGACTVHVDGVATRACMTPVGKLAGRRVVTIEGLSPAAGLTTTAGAATTTPAAATTASALHPVQRAWVELDVPQCGYCQAGQIMTAAALLARTPHPTDEEIVAGMNGNICRCGTYVRIRQAVRRAAELAAASTSAPPDEAS
jgi:isoquinoline 1-oxidoreductase alpha subunit